jgi:hypothetical protein
LFDVGSLLAGQKLNQDVGGAELGAVADSGTDGAACFVGVDGGDCLGFAGFSGAMATASGEPIWVSVKGVLDHHPSQPAEVAGL